MYRQIDSVVLGENYEITLDSVTIDDETGQQTWKYTVKELNGQDISNWAIEICETASVIQTTPTTNEIGNPNTGEGEGNCLNINNPIGCFFGETEPVVLKQIKWNVGADFSEGTFEFTLDECYPMGEVYVAVKAGDNCFCGTILGPICGDCPPPVTGRGILFI